MGKLSDVVNSVGGSWDNTDAAGDYEPLPKGEFEAVIEKGELRESRKGDTIYRLTFRVSGGEHNGRLFWHDVYFTTAALPYTKRDLTKLGVTSPAQLERPLPCSRCRVKLTRHTADSGVEFNKVARFEVLEQLKPEPNPFAPPASEGAA